MWPEGTSLGRIKRSAPLAGAQEGRRVYPRESRGKTRGLEGDLAGISMTSPDVPTKECGFPHSALPWGTGGRESEGANFQASSPDPSYITGEAGACAVRCVALGEQGLARWAQDPSPRLTVGKLHWRPETFRRASHILTTEMKTPWPRCTEGGVRGRPRTSPEP